MLTNDIAERNAWFWVIASALIVAFSLSIRSAGLYPVVAGDEYIHSMLARFTPPSDASIPSYIYASIYSSTNLCGDQFLACARILNAFLFSLSIPLVYIICRGFCGPQVALFVSIVLALGPINSYTAYFTPESAYYLVFLLTALVVIRGSFASISLFWGAAGLILAVAALIKPHAMFLLPAIAGCAFFGQGKDFHLINGIKAAACVILAFFITKFAVSFLLAGWPGLSLFGSKYGSVAIEASRSASERHIHVLKLAFENGVGHFLALFLLFGAAITEILFIAARRGGNKSESLSFKRLFLMNVFVFASLLLVVSLFTASIAGVNEFENNYRIHMRYYNFAFPLLVALVAAQLSSAHHRSLDNDENIWLRAAIGLPVGLAILYALVTRLSPYTPGFVDSPELRGITADSLTFYILTALSLFSVLVWICSRFYGLSLFLFLFFPLASVLSSYNINSEMRTRMIPDVWVKASFFAKSQLGDAELGRTVVVGSDITGMWRTLLMLNNPASTLAVIPTGREYAVSSVPNDKDWILNIGDHPIKGAVIHEVSTEDFGLVRVRKTLDFRQAKWPGLISKTKGLATPEDWGTWSDGSAVLLEFLDPLPERFRMRLVARAFGPNVGKQFTIRVGKYSFEFQLGETSEEVIGVIQNTDNAYTMGIEVPFPVAPSALGVSSDSRKLGIALESLRIEPIED